MAAGLGFETLLARIQESVLIDICLLFSTKAATLVIRTLAPQLFLRRSGSFFLSEPGAAAIIRKEENSRMRNLLCRLDEINRLAS